MPITMLGTYAFLLNSPNSLMAKKKKNYCLDFMNKETGPERLTTLPLIRLLESQT